MRVTCDDSAPPVWRVRMSASSPGGELLIDRGGVARLRDILDRAHRTPTCRVLVLEGQPERFCQGLDLKQVLAGSGFDPGAEVQAFADCLHQLHTSGAVVIAAVDGAVAGGGVGIAAAADILVATERSSFGLPELVLGLMPAVVFPILLERMTPQKARLLALSASVTARQAEAWGLVDRRVEDAARLDRAVRGAIKQALRCNPASVAGLPGLCERAAEQPCKEALDRGARLTARTLLDPGTIDPIRAFLEGAPLPWFDRYRPGRSSDRIPERGDDHE